MSKVTHIGHTEIELNVRQTLEKALLDCDNPDKLIAHSNKMLIICLDDTEVYDYGFINAGLSMSQALSLLECAKMLVLDEMEIINR